MIVKTMSGGPLIAGTANQLYLSSGAKGVALDGALLYAQDPHGVHEGSFTDKDSLNRFKDFPGCGKNRQGKFAGVIQQAVISDDVSFSTLQLRSCLNSAKKICD
jgi:hypothetical protein